MLDAATQARFHELADWIGRRCRPGRCPVVGINGAQGSGKSTAASFIAGSLIDRHGIVAAVLSIDDFYWPRAVRLQQSETVHPLLLTRGVPGTHDVVLGINTIRALQTLGSGDRLALPRYSKADDDRVPVARWPTITGPVDLILFEGWCVGTPPQTDDELSEPINTLEAIEDQDGRWRRHVNEQLQHHYGEWFSLLDALIFLQIPGFDAVHRWRWQQEQDTARTAPAGAAGLQSAAQLARFIQHYQRLTAHALRTLPAQADVTIELHDDHRVGAVHYRSA